MYGISRNLAQKKILTSVGEKEKYYLSFFLSLAAIVSASFFVLARSTPRPDLFNERKLHILFLI